MIFDDIQPPSRVTNKNAGSDTWNTMTKKNGYLNRLIGKKPTDTLYLHDVPMPSCVLHQFY